LRAILKPRLEALLTRPGNCGVPDPKNPEHPCTKHWRAFSPANVSLNDCNVQDGACTALGWRPVLLTHSDKDDRVPERQAFALCDGLRRKSHVAVAYYLVKGLPHGFMNFPYDQSVKVLGKFFEFLGNPKDTNPVCRAPL